MKVADQIGGAAMQCDVADFGACEAMIARIIKDYGHLDILVNNAGITRDGLILKMSEADFDAVLTTNLKGAFHTIRHASRYFLKPAIRADHQYLFRVRCHGKCGAGKLQRQQGRCHRSDQKRGERAGRAWRYL